MTLADLFIDRFVARDDVVAVQNSGGGYSPYTYPITARTVEAHLLGEATYGHYMINPHNNSCKFFCFDIDLKTAGNYWIEPDLRLADENLTHEEFGIWYERNRIGPKPVNPREAWILRSEEPRSFFKMQFRTLAELFSYNIADKLGIGTAVSYSGHKGIHVYGFTGLDDAANVRAAAEYVLEQLNIFSPARGKNFYIDTTGSFENVEIEVFPKQTEVKEGGYGNLLRFDLGVNQKNPNDPCFFLDQTTAQTNFSPHRNPHWLLTNLAPWSDYPNEGS